MAGVAAAYGLVGQNVLAQVIGVVSAVSIGDIVTRVSIVTIELGMNVMNKMFVIGDYGYL